TKDESRRQEVRRSRNLRLETGRKTRSGYIRKAVSSLGNDFGPTGYSRPVGLFLGFLPVAVSVSACRNLHTLARRAARRFAAPRRRQSPAFSKHPTFPRFISALPLRSFFFLGRAASGGLPCPWTIHLLYQISFSHRLPHRNREISL